MQWRESGETMKLRIPEIKKSTTKAPLRISALYVLVSGLWTLFSDKLLHDLVHDRAALTRISIFKDWFFIILTTVMGYALMRRSWESLRRSEEKLQAGFEALEAAHDELAAGEAHFRRIYDGISDGVVIQSVAGTVIHANPAACAMFDLTLRQLRAENPFGPENSVTYEDGSPFTWVALPAKVSGNSAKPDFHSTLTISSPGRPKRWIRLHSMLLSGSEIFEHREMITTVVDLTEQKRSERRETLLYGITQRILDEQPLAVIFQFLCDQLVDSLGYSAAWIGLKVPGGAISVRAHAGRGGAYMDNLNVRWDATPEGHGAVGEAIRSGQPQIHNLEGNPQFRPWWGIYQDLNLHSITVLPLNTNGETLGVLALYAQTPDFFGSALVSELQHFAEQIAMALDTAQNRQQLQVQNAALTAAANAMVLTDRSGNIEWANPAFTRLTGYTYAEVAGKKLSLLKSGIHPASFYRELWQEILAGKVWHGELINRRRDGTLYTEEMTITSVRTEQDEITHFIAVKQDVTERRQAEEAVWLEKERAQVTLESIGDAVITTDVRGNIDYLNPVAVELTGWDNAQGVGLPLLKVFNIIDEETGESVENPVERAIRDGRVVGLANHALLIHRDGYAFAIENSAAPIRNREGQTLGAVLVFHDVSDKRNMMRQLAHQAHHDALTGLPNRLLFNDRSNQAIAQAHRKQLKAGILFLDLDRFKLVNDTLGHSVGDHLLRAVADRLKGCLREGDTVARQGGDEFLILLPELAEEKQAVSVAQKILDIFAQSFSLAENEVFISPSLGIAIYPADGKDLDTLVKHADTAMYHAKEQGRNNYQFYTNALNQAASERLALESALRRAIEREEFVLYYQPQYDLSRGEICGFEALVRWKHPERGLVSPDQFIPIAEESGLILPLGEWVLRTACAQNRAWQDMGFESLRVAVNISARQFRQAKLVSTIAMILAETKLDPSCLELEITESIGMENVEFSIATLRELQNMGLRISIDDFGTGFSSLSYLSRFPIDTLKIDRSLVAQVPANPDDNEIVSAIINLAQGLGLKVIAEGVETIEQLTFLREKLCNEVQGYLFNPPLPVEKFGAILGKKTTGTL